MCAECESEFNGDVSPMPGLCPECSHLLYDYPNCDHTFVDGACARCSWDGSRSDFTKGLFERGEKANALREPDGQLWSGRLDPE